MRFFQTMDILKLSTCEPCTFEPVGSVTNVFFDDRCQQVFSVRSGGATGIQVRSFTDSKCTTFRTEDQGPIISIKLSPDQKILAVQRTKTNVQFHNVNHNNVPNGSERKLEKKEYSQSCKSKNATILGFVWTSNTEIVYITSHGIEIYSVLSEKRNVKALKHLNTTISFFSFCAQSSLLVTSSCQPATILQVFVIKNGGNIVKLSKIESNALVTQPNQDESVEIREKDVSIINLYSGQTFIAIIQHPSITLPDSAPSSTHTLIHMYRVSKEHSTVTRTHVLRAPFVGGIALNIVDDLIIVHHQGSGTSGLFDIAFQGESDGHITHHQHLGSPVQLEVNLQPLVRHHPAISPTHEDALTNASSESNSGMMCYSPNWVTFVPDIIIDAKQGRMWKVQLKLDFNMGKKQSGTSNEMDLPKLTGFLLHRYGSKMMLLDLLLQHCLSEETDLQSVGDAFDLINREYRVFLDTQMQTNLALSASMSSFEVFGNINNQLPSGISAKENDHVLSKVVLDEADLYTNLFCPLLEELGNSRSNLKRIISFILEYIRSLEEEQIPVQHFLNELLINLLVQNGSWYQLHQLLQYHVIVDSKPLACLLLSLESVYPAAGQLAIDMLVRLKNSSDEICEILLSKNRIISALQFASTRNLFSNEIGSVGVRTRKFLEASVQDIDVDENEISRKVEEHIVFHTVYNFFDERNMLDRGCDQYKELYHKLFAEN